jgi:hypothetical protein
MARASSQNDSGDVDAVLARYTELGGGPRNVSAISGPIGAENC